LLFVIAILQSRRHDVDSLWVREESYTKRLNRKDARLTNNRRQGIRKDGAATSEHSSLDCQWQANQLRQRRNGKARHES
jgi:hypothetical protein